MLNHEYVRGLNWDISEHKSWLHQKVNSGIRVQVMDASEGKL